MIDRDIREDAVPEIEDVSRTPAELLQETCRLIVEGSRELAALMASGDDLERRAHNVESIEKRGDKITRTTIELLHKTFITPIDRDDIHQLITEMDDILDLIEDSAQLMFLYDVRVLHARGEEARGHLRGLLREGEKRRRAALQHGQRRRDHGDLPGHRPARVGRRPRDARGHRRACSGTSPTCAS